MHSPDLYFTQTTLIFYKYFDERSWKRLFFVLLGGQNGLQATLTAVTIMPPQSLTASSLTNEVEAMLSF